MPSSLTSFAEFDELLSAARSEIAVMLLAEPGDGAIGSVKRQLDVVYEWTRNGRCPEQSEKDQLNFGQIASRELDSYPVASSLYQLASFIIYWGEHSS
jgi:hypothetical protein